jgi:hypothetical protein
MLNKKKAVAAAKAPGLCETERKRTNRVVAIFLINMIFSPLVSDIGFNIFPKVSRMKV